MDIRIQKQMSQNHVIIPQFYSSEEKYKGKKIKTMHKNKGKK